MSIVTCVWRIADLCQKSVIRHTQAGGNADRDAPGTARESRTGAVLHQPD
jgi:hypothetical protein